MEPVVLDGVHPGKKERRGGAGEVEEGIESTVRRERHALQSYRERWTGLGQSATFFFYRHAAIWRWPCVLNAFSGVCTLWSRRDVPGTTRTPQTTG